MYFVHGFNIVLQIDNASTTVQVSEFFKKSVPVGVSVLKFF